MEIIEIKSTHNLTTSGAAGRPVGAHSYMLNCHQYVSTYQYWQKHNLTQDHAFGVMTLGFERIWITEAEGKQLAEAVRTAQSPVLFD